MRFGGGRFCLSAQSLSRHCSRTVASRSMELQPVASSRLPAPWHCLALRQPPLRVRAGASCGPVFSLWLLWKTLFTKESGTLKVHGVRNRRALPPPQEATRILPVSSVLHVFECRFSLAVPVSVTAGQGLCSHGGCVAHSSADCHFLVSPNAYRK